MAKDKWAPHDLHYESVNGEFRGVTFVQEALKNAGIELGKEVLTSRDPRVQQAQAQLKAVEQPMPPGITKWQLPILFSDIKPTFMFVTVAAPSAVVPAHVHHELCIFRFIVSGSIVHKDIELKQGDWMFVPGGNGYTYTAGALGAVILHKYVGV